MTPEEKEAVQSALICAIKELGEIAECIVKGDPDDHWKEELADLCGLAIQPMLGIAGADYHDACLLGRMRKARKLNT